MWKKVAACLLTMWMASAITISRKDDPEEGLKNRVGMKVSVPGREPLPIMACDEHNPFWKDGVCKNHTIVGPVKAHPLDKVGGELEAIDLNATDKLRNKRRLEDAPPCGKESEFHEFVKENFHDGGWLECTTSFGLRQQHCTTSAGIEHISYDIEKIGFCYSALEHLNGKCADCLAHFDEEMINHCSCIWDEKGVKQNCRGNDFCSTACRACTDMMNIDKNFKLCTTQGETMHQWSCEPEEDWKRKKSGGDIGNATDMGDATEPEDRNATQLIAPLRRNPEELDD